MSPSDALYSIEFLKMLLELQVPKLNVLNILSYLIKGFNCFIHCSSLNEGDCLGLFIVELFKTMDQWTRNDGEYWKKTFSKYSGFAKLVGDPNQIVTFERLTQIVKQIHSCLTQFLMICLEDPKKQIMKTKCVLKILNRIIDVFPQEKKQAEHILEKVDLIAKQTEIHQSI